VECDQEIEKLLGEFEPRVDPSEKPLPPDRKRKRIDKKTRKKNGNPETGFDLRTEAYRLYGIDVTQIPGVEMIALPLFSEVGGICPDSRRQPILLLGWGCARTTTLAAAVCCGREFEG
jgi:hypothetical protein